MRLLRFIEQQRTFRRAFAHRAQVADFAEPRAEQQPQRFLILKLATCRSGTTVPRRKPAFVVTTTVSVLPTPVGPSSRKLPRGRTGFVRPSSPRRTAEMIRGSAWDWPRISRGNNASSSWSLVSFVESGVLFIAYLYQDIPCMLCRSYTRLPALCFMLRPVISGEVAAQTTEKQKHKLV